MESLSISEQKKIAKKIRRNVHNEPISCLLTSLCLYHGLASREIASIRIDHINFEGRCIYFQERPPVYLTTEDLLILEQYVKERAQIKKIDKKNFLIVSLIASSYQDKSVSNLFINKKIKNFTGYTPKKLRITCFCALSAMYGPQFLIEAFGLSLTQASRYGRIGEYIVEEEVYQQRDAL
ncbi:site-specific integrase [Peribacillus frigoritolerans]|uniref:hypothetical protein n=1 Tax=Peribacillus castrilensis TaxID=2897690 RepID=UPI002DC9A0D5|nr:hypothetical protein [Peribacillus castrilensis]